MNKVLSRTLMLGALVGCMATAAWAGNVEVNPEDFCPGTYEAGAQVETNAAGYYVTGYKFEDVQSSESMGVDANGNIVWTADEGRNQRKKQRDWCWQNGR